MNHYIKGVYAHMTYFDVYTSRRILKLLSMDVINHAPHENADNAFQCNYCHNLAASPVSTKCGHLFCRVCIYSWSQSIGHIIFPCPKCGAPSVYGYMVPLYGRGIDPPTTHVATRIDKKKIMHNKFSCFVPHSSWRDPILEVIASVRSEEGDIANVCGAKFLAEHPEVRWQLIENVISSIKWQHKRTMQLANCGLHTDHLLLDCILKSCIMFEEMRGVPYRSRNNVAMVLEALEDMELELSESSQEEEELRSSEDICTCS